MSLSEVGFLAAGRYLILLHRVQIASGPHLVSYSVGTEGYFSGDKAAGA
jgi:hypothetical protein